MWRCVTCAPTTPGPPTSICAFRTANKQAFERGKSRVSGATPPSRKHQTEGTVQLHRSAERHHGKRKRGSIFEQCYNAQGCGGRSDADRGSVRGLPAAAAQAGVWRPTTKKELRQPWLRSPGGGPQVETVLTDRRLLYSEAAVKAVEQNPDGTPTGVTVYAAV